MKNVDLYKAKRVSAEKAVEVVRSGDWIEFGFFANLPRQLDRALALRLGEIKNIHLRGGVLMAPLECLEGENSQECTWNSWHFGGLDRLYASKGKAFYIPLRYSELPRYLRENIRTDVVMIQAAPMDSHGWMNFGVSFSHFSAAIEKARHVIVEINQNMPRVNGGYDNAVHISQVDHIVEAGNCGVPEIPLASPSEIERRMAEFVLPEIPDGACLQLGIGGVPAALGNMIAQSDLKNLGVHSEMLADSFVDIFEAGKITGKHKQIDPGRIVFTFAAGTRRLYDFMENNPLLLAYPVDYVNHPCIASKNEMFASINGALEMDLSGQVCSESIGCVQFSGTGGQQDFVEAAYFSRNGKSFLCLPSTYEDKTGSKVSRIKPMLTNGAVVTATRTNTHWVVTEYGKANLKGLSSWQRAEKIIGIAHPDFREQLIAEAEKMKIWRNTNKIAD